MVTKGGSECLLPVIMEQSDSTTLTISQQWLADLKRRRREERELRRITYLALWSSGKWGELEAEWVIGNLTLWAGGG